MSDPTQHATSHYLTDEVDPLFIRGARDFLFPHLKHGHILNVGLGYGTWDERLATLDDSVVGLDLDGELVEHFRAKYPSIRYVVSDVFDYVPERPIDSIVASHFLEHIDRPLELLTLWKSWLAPGGRILLVVPNAESLHRQIGKRMGLLTELTDLNDSDRRIGHKRVYTLPLFREHLEQSDLAIVLLAGVTLKCLSNAQLAQLPRSYVEACIALGPELGTAACQLAAVVTAK
jgi:SAM-dependent methyltransferase